MDRVRSRNHRRRSGLSVKRLLLSALLALAPGLRAQSNISQPVPVTMAAGSNPCQNPEATLVSTGVTTSGTAAVQIVALSGSTKVYICSLTVIGQSGTNPTFSLVQGTGSSCASGQTTVVPAFATPANTLFAFANPVSVGAAGNALCYLDAGTTPVQKAQITYVQQ